MLQIDFEKGTQPGYDDAAQVLRLFGGWTTTNEYNNTEYSEIYESTRFKIPTADFETQEVGVKVLGYWGVGMNNTNKVASQLYNVMRGTGSSTSIMSSWNLDLYSRMSRAPILPQNMNIGDEDHGRRLAPVRDAHEAERHWPRPMACGNGGWTAS